MKIRTDVLNMGHHLVSVVRFELDQIIMALCRIFELIKQLSTLYECNMTDCRRPGLTLEGDSGEEVALWLLTSFCTSAKREVEVAL